MVKVRCNCKEHIGWGVVSLQQSLRLLSKIIVSDASKLVKFYWKVCYLLYIICWRCCPFSCILNMLVLNTTLNIVC